MLFIHSIDKFVSANPNSQSIPPPWQTCLFSMKDMRILMRELQSKAGSVSEGQMASVFRKERVKRLRVDSACIFWVLYPRDPVLVSLLTTGLGPFFPATPFLYETDYSEDASPLPTFSSSQLCLPATWDHWAHLTVPSPSTTSWGSDNNEAGTKRAHAPPPLTQPNALGSTL